MLRGREIVLFLVFLSIFLSSITNVRASVIINEVLPNPSIDWNSNGKIETYGDEWIELYSDVDTNINNWIIGDKVKNYTINDKVICSGCTLLLYGSETGLQLNNNDEEINLYDNNGNLVEKVGYSSSSKDVSLCKCSGTLENCEPTPNSPNKCDADTNPSQQQTQADNSAKINFEYPKEVFNNNDEFKVNVSFINFPSGIYDIKVEVKNSTDNTGKILGNNGWISSYYYLESAVDISSGQNYQFSLKINSNFYGDATIQLKVRNDTYSFQSPLYEIEVLNREIQNSLQLSTQTQQSSFNSNNSYLLIIKYPSKASFGGEINVNITAYRGDTSQSVVYLYIKKNNELLSERASVSLEEKFINYSFTVPLQIKDNCGGSYDEGTYSLILDGLNKIAIKDIGLRGNTNCESEEAARRGKVTYSIDFPDEIEIGKEFVVSVKIYNYQNKRRQFSAWSYVDLDSKCYSCGNNTRGEKGENAQQEILNGYESTTLFLRNTISNAEEGSYKLRIKILKEDDETTKDFTFDIFAKNIPSEENNTIAESILNSKPLENESESKITGKVVYQASRKSPITTIFLLVLLFLLLLLYFVLKKKPPYEREEGNGIKEEKKTEEEVIKEEIEENINEGSEESEKEENGI